MAKSKSKSPFTGRWHIVSMSSWEDEALNKEVQAFIELDEEGMGKFQFGYVRGVTDHSTGTEKTAQTALRWTVLGG